MPTRDRKIRIFVIEIIHVAPAADVHVLVFRPPLHFERRADRSLNGLLQPAGIVRSPGAVNLGERQARARLDLMVELDEAELEPAGQATSERAFARTAKSQQRNDGGGVRLAGRCDEVGRRRVRAISAQGSA